MADGETGELIENLKRSNRFWKRLAVGLLAALGLSILLLATSIAIQTMRAQRAEAAAMDLLREQAAKHQLDRAKNGQDKLQQPGTHP
jgi:hypothetical protein